MASSSALDDSALTSPTMAMGPSMDFKTALIALLLTMLCGAVGLCFWLRYELGKVRGESLPKEWMVPSIIYLMIWNRLGWGIWDESRAETMEQRRGCYMDSEMCEVSDDEYWRSIHYGPKNHLVVMMSKERNRASLMTL